MSDPDWLKQGLTYVDLESSSDCPFCQRDTLTKALVESIESYFGPDYQKGIATLTALKNEYGGIIAKYKGMIDDYKKERLPEDQKKNIDLLCEVLRGNITENLARIKNKIDRPAIAMELNSSKESLDNINNLIKEINKEIDDFNNKMQDENSALKALGRDFWHTMRRGYNSTIEIWNGQNELVERDISQLDKTIKSNVDEILKQNDIIQENQKKVVNIEDATNSINQHLTDFGIADFKITKSSEVENSYVIARGEQEEQIFNTLSEGEKNVISFLYFVEHCKGRETEDDIKQKIVVIDDPISSLSHMYIFNMAQLINKTFFRKENSIQVFVLTHSLYFFNAILRIVGRKKHEFFRVTKNETSTVECMKNDEVQNEYQAYWSVVRNANGYNKFLMANAMRNIIEFSFLKKVLFINCAILNIYI